MSPQDVLPLLTGPAAALVILVWVVWMQRQDIKELRKALEAANRRADTGEEAARTTLAVLTHITGQDRDGGGR